MPQPTYGDVHISAALTQISVAYLQSEDNYLAAKIFPVVPVVHQTDQYFVYTKDDYFRDEAQVRADGTESAGSGFNLSTQSYAAKVWALHKDIGEQARRNADPAVDLDIATTKWLTQKMLIRRDVLFATAYMATSVWATDITGVTSSPSASQAVYWNDDAGSDPITDVSNGQTTMLQNTGHLPNVLALSWPVYQALRKHPLIIDRIKFTMPGGATSSKITPALLAEAFDVDEVMVAKAVYNTAAEGLTGSYSFIVGKHALLCYRSDAPSLWTPSAGYIFAWEGFTGLNSIGLRIQNIPTPLLGASSNRLESEMAFDMPVVGRDLGYFFSGIVQ